MHRDRVPPDIAVKPPVPTPVATGEWHMFSDTTGKYTVVAKFLRFKDGKAHLERKDNGKILALSMNSLSEGDRAWIRAELKKTNVDESE